MVLIVYVFIYVFFKFLFVYLYIYLFIIIYLAKELLFCNHIKGRLMKLLELPPHLPPGER